MSSRNLLRATAVWLLAVLVTKYSIQAAVTSAATQSSVSAGVSDGACRARRVEFDSDPSKEL